MLFTFKFLVKTNSTGYSIIVLGVIFCLFITVSLNKRDIRVMLSVYRGKYHINIKTMILK